MGLQFCELTWYDPALGGTNSASGAADPHSATSSGEPYSPTAMTCAAPPAYRFGTWIQFLANGKSVTCRVNDRGGAIQGAHFDLARAPATALGVINQGVAHGQFQVVNGPTGGTVGLGGTGTQPNTKSSAAFTVGDSSNPDEDYFTAINRLAQSAYWYSFSDGETFYVADGTLLMQQQPAAVIDRFDSNTLHVDLTYDNTAWTYASHHKKKGRIQRKATLAKVTSPVEATVDWICAIDAIRAGDVVHLTSCGPGDGPWLVGDCTRSVFNVYSELTLVPALAPIKAASNVSADAASGAPPGTGNYVNPFSKINNLVPLRVDMGVDYGGTGTILALGDAVIVYSANSGSGWPGGGAIVYQLTGGPYRGKYVYIAEHIVTTVQTGQKVKAGDGICTLLAGYPYCETGWASGSGSGTLASSLGQQAPGDPGGWTSAAGASFNKLLISLGCKSGILQGPSHGTMPPGYP